MAVRKSKKEKSIRDLNYDARTAGVTGDIKGRKQIMQQAQNLANNTMQNMSKRGRMTDAAESAQLASTGRPSSADTRKYSAPYREDRISSPQNRVWRNNIGLRFGQAGDGNGNVHVNYITGLATEEQDRKAMGQATH